MQVFVVQKKGKPGEGTQVWVFTEHDDALRCRREQKVDSHGLWGCVVNCYQFKKDK